MHLVVASRNFRPCDPSLSWLNRIRLVSPRWILSQISYAYYFRCSFLKGTSTMVGLVRLWRLNLVRAFDFLQGCTHRVSKAGNGKYSVHSSQKMRSTTKGIIQASLHLAGWPPAAPQWLSRPKKTTMLGKLLLDQYFFWKMWKAIRCSSTSSKGRDLCNFQFTATTAFYWDRHIGDFGCWTIPSP